MNTNENTPLPLQVLRSVVAKAISEGSPVVECIPPAQTLSPDFLLTPDQVKAFPQNAFPAGRPRGTRVEGDLSPRKIALATPGEETSYNYPACPSKIAILWEIPDGDGPAFYSWCTTSGERFGPSELTVRTSLRDLYWRFPNAKVNGIPSLFDGGWDEENRDLRHEKIKEWAQYDLPCCAHCASHPERDPSSWSYGAEGTHYGRALLFDGRPDLEGLEWPLDDEGPILCDVCHTSDREAVEETTRNAIRDVLGVPERAYKELLTLQHVREGSKVLIQAGMDGRFSWWEVGVLNSWFLVWGSEEGCVEEALDALPESHPALLATEEELAESVGMELEEFRTLWRDEEECWQVTCQFEYVNGGQFYVNRGDIYFGEAR